MHYIAKLCKSILALCSVDTVCKYIFWACMWTLSILCNETDTAWVKVSIAMLAIDTAMFICYMYWKHQ
jgi:hypothetical protein